MDQAIAANCADCIPLAHLKLALAHVVGVHRSFRLDHCDIDIRLFKQRLGGLPVSASSSSASKWVDQDADLALVRGILQCWLPEKCPLNPAMPFHNVERFLSNKLERTLLTLLNKVLAAATTSTYSGLFLNKGVDRKSGELFVPLADISLVVATARIVSCDFSANDVL